ncbi:hypothetical protein D3C81_336880 [compost metagenome]
MNETFNAAMSDTQFGAWLRNPAARRLVLIEVAVRSGGQERMRFLSTGAYVTAPDDTPPNLAYQSIVSTGMQFTEQLSLGGEASLSAGDIEIHNPSGIRDAWLDDVWMNRPIRAWIGDPRWRRGDFRMIFNGVVADVAPKGRDKLALKLRDKLQRLNTPVSEAKLGGATPNKDAVLPLVFGEVHNITPLLADPALLQYQVHDGAIEEIIEVRDNGVPVRVTADKASGKFVLVAPPAGTLTVSVQGDRATGYATTVAALVRRLATGYGKAGDRFADGDLDTANLAAFDAAHPQAVGLFLAGRTNVLNACQMLASSLGAQLVMSRLGQLRLLQISLPPAGTPAAVGPQHMVAGSLTPVSRNAPTASVKLGFSKNWTVQSGLQTGIPVQHKDLFETEWLTATRADARVQADYRLDAEPVQQDTMLLRRVDAEAEAQRRLAISRLPRTAYEFDGTAEMLALELGQAVTVTHPRFGMENGVAGQVVSLAPDWLTGHVKVGFIV